MVAILIVSFHHHSRHLSTQSAAAALTSSLTRASVHGYIYLEPQRNLDSILRTVTCTTVAGDDSEAHRVAARR